jgi:hypothetical protein
MTLSDILAIGIGIAFIYALFSMLASVIKEAIAAKLQWRAKNLAAGIKAMVASPGSAAGSAATLAERVYGHAMVSGASQNGSPSYLPARNFTLALLDELLAGSQAPVITGIEQAVAALPEGVLKQRLQVYVNDGAGDADALKSKIDAWFDDTMDRLSGIYKRNTQVVLFAIGLALAIVVNVDTLRIFNELQHNEKARAATESLAEKFHADHPGGADKASGEELNKAILTLPAPIGWTSCPDPPGTCKADNWVVGYVIVAPGKSWWGPLSELIGWLMTAVAISFGAPFWFDLLGQLINIRSAGPKPPRAGGQGAAGSPS